MSTPGESPTDPSVLGGVGEPLHGLVDRGCRANTKTTSCCQEKYIRNNLNGNNILKNMLRIINLGTKASGKIAHALIICNESVQKIFHVNTVS